MGLTCALLNTQYHLMLTLSINVFVYFIKEDMESTENRFAHLLQPIRELTKNWDIDVASELNDYLEEVKQQQQ